MNWKDKLVIQLLKKAEDSTDEPEKDLSVESPVVATPPSPAEEETEIPNVVPVVTEPVTKPPLPIRQKYAALSDEEVLKRVIECVLVTKTPVDAATLKCFDGRRGRRLLNELFVINQDVYSEFARNAEFIGAYYDEQYARVKNYPHAEVFPHVPDRYRTPELCEMAVEASPWNLKYVPDSSKTLKMCWTAIKEHGQTLAYVPRDMITYDMCMAAVKRTPSALFGCGVPEDMMTYEMCEMAIEDDPDLYSKLPPHFLTPHMYELAVGSNGEILQDLPNEVKTFDICMAAVKERGSVLAYVPMKLRTKELCIEAVKETASAVLYVPPKMLTTNFWLKLISVKPEVIVSLPQPLRAGPVALDFYLAAVKKNGLALEFVPMGKKNQAICEAAVNQNVNAFKYVPNHGLTKEMIYNAVRGNGLLLQEVPHTYKTQELCEIAVNQNPRSIRYVPVDLLTPELCDKGIRGKHASQNFADVPLSMKTVEMSWRAVEQEGAAIFSVPDHLLTSDLCCKALEVSPTMLTQGMMAFKPPFKYKGIDTVYVAAFKAYAKIYPELLSHGIYRKYIVSYLKSNTAPCPIPEDEDKTSEWIRKSLGYGSTQISVHDLNLLLKDKVFLEAVGDNDAKMVTIMTRFFSTDPVDLLAIVKKYYELFKMGYFPSASEESKMTDQEREQYNGRLSGEGLNRFYIEKLFSPQLLTMGIKDSALLGVYSDAIVEWQGSGLPAESVAKAIDSIESKKRNSGGIPEKVGELGHFVRDIDGFTFEMLKTGDVLGLVVGDITKCCQKIEGEAEAAVWDGFFNPKANFLIVRNRRGRLIAQSWVRLGEDKVLYLDNIEAVDPFDRTHMEKFDKLVYESLRQAFVKMASLLKEEHGLSGVVVGQRYGDVVFDELGAEIDYWDVAEDIRKRSTDISPSHYNVSDLQHGGHKIAKKGYGNICKLGERMQRDLRNHFEF